MPSRFATTLVCLGVAALASCTKATPTAVPAPATPVTVAGAASPPDGPFAAVEGRQEYTLRGDTRLQIWDLKASGLKTLAAKLLVARDGKAEPVSEVEYKWNEWAAKDKVATGRLLLLMQEGREFGAANKRLPSLTLDLQNSPSHARTSQQSGLTLDGELHSRMSSAGYSTPLGRSNVLYAQVFTPKTNSPGFTSVGSDMESAVAASREGATVLIVTLDWAPQP